MGTDTWNPAPAFGDDGGWKPDTDAMNNAWQPDFSGDYSSAEGIKPENFSMHAGGGDDFDAGAADGGCRICHEDGHFARDCPQKGDRPSGCFNCGEEGHNKAECPNERVEREFTGECRSCGEVGHRAADCPTKGPLLCKICKQEGHKAADCDANRVFANFANMGIKDVPVEEAWKIVEQADEEKDMEDVKKAILTYAKAYPEVTFEELESVFREARMNTYLIAKQKEIADTMNIVNLQGKKDQKYVVIFQLSDKPKRAKFAEGWPESPEENMSRLAEAGIVVDGMVVKCSNCNELGHISKSCPQEKVDKTTVAITCANCNEEGHRARDCKQQRKRGGRECKNCGEVGHLARDCPTKEPEVCRNCQEEGHRAKDCDKERVVTCRNCDETGHRAAECPLPKNMAKVQCRNCDEFGHEGRDCPKPRDYSRVKCSNCQEMGHTYKRCPKPPAETDANDGGAGGDGGWGNDTAGGASGGGWGNDAGGDASGGW